MTLSLVRWRRARASLWILAGAVSWQWVAVWTVGWIWVAALQPDPSQIWLYDWHVYAAGAQDLLTRELYHAPLTFEKWPLPVSIYNLPPVSAVWALPLLALEDEAAGIIWVALGALAWASAWWLGFRMSGVRGAWVWTGMALVTYASALHWFNANLLLGNINHLVLGVVAAFALAHANGRARVAGILLGVAIATKLWPVALLVPVARQRQWNTIVWALSTAVVTTAIPILWLGMNSVEPMIAALRLRVPIEPGVAVLWTSAFREMWTWWPAWGSIAVATALLAVPARGLTGIGLAICAGITLIPNIWDHYLPTLLLGVLWLAAGVRTAVVIWPPVRTLAVDRR